MLNIVDLDHSDILVNHIMTFTGLNTVLSTLFHEELGYIIEVKQSDLSKVKKVLEASSIIYQHIGQSTTAKVGKHIKVYI